ncbi:hypothetical protein ACRAWD_22900 [Caulobacter segnis]
MIVDLPKGWKLNADYSGGGSSLDIVLDMKSVNLDYYNGLATGRIDPLGGQQAFPGRHGRRHDGRPRHARSIQPLSGPIVAAGGPDP